MGERHRSQVSKVQARQRAIGSLLGLGVGIMDARLGSSRRRGRSILSSLSKNPGLRQRTTAQREGEKVGSRGGV